MKTLRKKWFVENADRLNIKHLSLDNIPYDRLKGRYDKNIHESVVKILNDFPCLV